MTACTWQRCCPQRNVHLVWRTTRSGLVAHERVCAKHLNEAAAYGYRIDPPPVPPPDLPNVCEWSSVCRGCGGHRLVKVPYPGGPVEDKTVCPVHLLPARAEGWLPAG